MGILDFFFKKEQPKEIERIKIRPKLSKINIGRMTITTYYLDLNNKVVSRIDYIYGDRKRGAVSMFDIWLQQSVQYGVYQLSDRGDEVNGNINLPRERVLQLKTLYEDYFIDVETRE